MRTDTRGDTMNPYTIEEIKKYWNGYVTAGYGKRAAKRVMHYLTAILGHVPGEDWICNNIPTLLEYLHEDS